MKNDNNQTGSHPAGSRSDDWFTPAWLFEEIGLRFDLDPCYPSGIILPWVPVDSFYTEEENGLIQPWAGRVWLNPPYSNTEEWLFKMAHEARQGLITGIALAFARTETKWFDHFWQSDAILFLDKRIQFVNQDGATSGSPGSGSALAAWGPDCVVVLAKMAMRGLGYFHDPWASRHAMRIWAKG